MNPKLLLAAAITATFAGSSHADFYVVENQSTHKCSVVIQQPSPGTIDRVVGEDGYTSQQEAEAAMRNELACANTPTGGNSATTTSGPPSPAAAKCGSYLAKWPCRR